MKLGSISPKTWKIAALGMLSAFAINNCDGEVKPNADKPNYSKQLPRQAEAVITCTRELVLDLCNNGGNDDYIDLHCGEMAQQVEMRVAQRQALIDFLKESGNSKVRQLLEDTKVGKNISEKDTAFKYLTTTRDNVIAKFNLDEREVYLCPGQDAHKANDEESQTSIVDQVEEVNRPREIATSY